MKPTGAALSDNYSRWEQEAGINLQSEVCMINNTVLDVQRSRGIIQKAKDQNDHAVKVPTVPFPPKRMCSPAL